MPSTAMLVWSSIEPVLAGHRVRGLPLTGRPADDGSAGSRPGCVWCAGTRDFLRRHPTVTAAVDVEHPDGCTDLVGRTSTTAVGWTAAFMECLDLDDGLVGLPIEQVIPVLAERIADVLG